MATQSKTNSTLAEALVAIQAEAPQIPLDSTNPHFKSKFASLAGVMERVRPVTTKHGVAVIQLPTTQDSQPALTTRLVHSSGEEIESTMLLLPGKSDPQGQGSALTYARRYMVLAMLGLVGDEDDDGNAGSPPTQRSTPTATAKAPERSARPATAKQKGKINALFGAAELPERHATAIVQWHGGVAQLDRLPSKSASKLIDRLGEDGSGATEILIEIHGAADDDDERAKKIAERYLDEEDADVEF